MSDAQKLIADVMEQHQEHVILGRYWVAKCSPACGWIGNQPYGFRNQAYEAHRAHVAAEIDKALGGLTIEYASGQILPGERDYTVTDGSRGSSRKNAESCLYFPRFKLIQHWVSGWSEVQP